MTRDGAAPRRAVRRVSSGCLGTPREDGFPLSDRAERRGRARAAPRRAACFLVAGPAARRGAAFFGAHELSFARATCIFPRLLWPGTETYCILERFVDFWEIFDWGLGLSYNSGFSFCNLMQSDAIFIASAAAVSTLQ